jgi:ubiquitin-conjugating enzyme E2 M
MSFSDARIQRDLDNLNIPITFKKTNRIVDFQLEIDTEIYKGFYDFTISFPDEYPFKSPKLKCLTKVFHPNIDIHGNVCLKILREGWMPSYDFNSIIVSILCTFYYLNSDDALNTEAGQLLDQNYDEFKRRALNP